MLQDFKANNTSWKNTHASSLLYSLLYEITCLDISIWQQQLHLNAYLHYMRHFATRAKTHDRFPSVGHVHLLSQLICGFFLLMHIYVWATHKVFSHPNVHTRFHKYIHPISSIHFSFSLSLSVPKCFS